MKLSGHSGGKRKASRPKSGTETRLRVSEKVLNQKKGGKRMFTFLLAILVAKYGETAFGDKSTATKVGTIAGAIADAGIVAWIVIRYS